jgi:hypothetical protein
MNLWQWLERMRTMRTEPDATRIAVTGGLGLFAARPSWIWRAIFLFSLLALGVGLFAYLVAVALPSN